MTYYSNSNLQDVATAIEDARDKLRDVKNDTVEELLDNLGALDSALDNIESELNYVDSDFEELEGFREFAENASLEGIEDEYDLREVIEQRDGLKKRVEELEARPAADEEARLKMADVIINQGQLINRLKVRLGEIEVAAREPVMWTMWDDETKLLPAPTVPEVAENFEAQVKGDE